MPIAGDAFTPFSLPQPTGRSRASLAGRSGGGAVRPFGSRRLHSGRQVDNPAREFVGIEPVVFECELYPSLQSKLPERSVIACDDVEAVTIAESNNALRFQEPLHHRVGNFGANISRTHQVPG